MVPLQQGHWRGSAPQNFHAWHLFPKKDAVTEAN